MGLREEARAAYRAVAGALAELAAQAGKLDETIRYRLRIVERDPYDEESQLGLSAPSSEPAGTARRGAPFARTPRGWSRSGSSRPRSRLPPGRRPGAGGETL